MKIIKRDGREVPFDYRKIRNAIEAANAEVAERDRLSRTEVGFLVGRIERACSVLGRAVHVEEIQDLIIDELERHDHYRLARHYSEYRLRHEQQRHMNTTDGKILSLLERNNEEAKQENANKNPIINSTMRDYMAGEVSRDICRRFLFPADVMKAHDEGIIHVHDMDYVAEHVHNCDLVNLEDMLQNGTVISGTLIEKPHSFSTACNIATQIIAQVASNQYGGQTISLAHLAPFVDVSRQKYRQEVKTELDAAGMVYSEDVVNTISEKRVREEVKRGVQTIQYQVVTLLTTNGQAPFITVFMYLDEVPEGQTRDDLAMIIEETLNQRWEGVKNEKGVWISPAFPKLIYVLDEDNITEGSTYWYLTELAAKCTARRLVPDYISAKVMRELKGEVYTCTQAGKRRCCPLRVNAACPLAIAPCKKKKVNEGEISQYYVENNHTAIIDPTVHEQVQREIERRNGAYSGVRIFSGKIRCAECISWFGSKVWHSNDKYRRVIWQCNHKFDGKRCTTPHLTEEQIKTAFLAAVNEVLNGRKKAIAAFEAAKSSVFDTTALEIELASLETEMQVISEKMQALIRENATVALDQEEYQKKFQAMSDRFDQAKAKKTETEKQISDKKVRLNEIEEYMRLLKKQDGRVEEFNPELWCGLLDFVTVGENMVFTFRDGTEVEV